MSSHFSCEPGRKKAYSEDLRWRVVWQKEAMGLKLKEIARNLSIDTSTACRIHRKFISSGSVSKKLYPSGSRPTKKLTDTVQMLILNIVVESPQLYLREIIARVLMYTGFELSPALLCGFLHKMNFSRQKMQMVARQRDEKLRREFVDGVSLYEPHMLVFIDETGTDRRDSLRKYGYSLRGKTPKSCRMLIRGERISVIGIMTLNGILDLHIVRGGVNGDEFVEFVDKCLLPVLMPYNGVNPNSIVILDNCSIHHVEPVKRLINGVGAMVHYLPPYSPDYNPIEWCFSKVKQVISALELEMEAIEDIELIARIAFNTVTPEDCQSWVEDCGIYNY